MPEIKIDPARLREWAARITDDVADGDNVTLDATERGMLASALTMAADEIEEARTSSLRGGCVVSDVCAVRRAAWLALPIVERERARQAATALGRYPDWLDATTILCPPGGCGAAVGAPCPEYTPVAADDFCLCAEPKDIMGGGRSGECATCGCTIPELHPVTPAGLAAGIRALRRTVLAEREACAREAESGSANDPHGWGKAIAAAIRARR